MPRPNYNLIRFIRRNIRNMKSQYGGHVTLYTIGSVSTDYRVGVKTESHTSYEINKAIVLPVRLSTEVIQTISMISANKKFVQGGTFDAGTRTFIIDRSDLPSGVTIEKDDWLVYLGKRYELKWIDEFEQNTAWVITAKSLEGHVIAEDIPGIANGTRLGIGGTAAAIVGDPNWLLRTDGSVVFDPTVVITSGTATWIFGDGASETANSASHTYSATGDYPVSFDVSTGLLIQIDAPSDGITKIKTRSGWVNLTALYVQNNNLTTLDTFAAWVDFNYLRADNNSLTFCKTHNTWVDLTTLFLHGNLLTTLDTYSDWINITYLRVDDNDLSTLNTFSTWVKLVDLYAQNNNFTALDTYATWVDLRTLSLQNNFLETLTFYTAWTKLLTVRLDGNSLPASEIDAILIALDGAGASNGTLNYSSNPGSADVSRSGAAATAKSNLVTNGWVITI